MALIKFANEKEVTKALAAAMQSGDEDKIQEAWENFHKSVAEQVMADCEEIIASNDSVILAQRGYRQLTNKETQWYQKLINAMKSANPKQAFIDFIGSGNEEDFMPTTIIEDVYKDLAESHELLKVINFQYVGHITKWLLNDHATQKAVWGTITDEIVKEITSSFKTIDLVQSKLSAFACVEKGMLDLGPAFLDGYIRTVLAEALLEGLEEGIIAGTGVNQPTGLIKDIHKGVSKNEETGYPNKTKEVVKAFTPKEYGALIAKLALTETGKKRKFGEVVLVVNMNDYLTKVMPATTVLNANGVYVNNLFPFPTKVIVSNVLEDGNAVMFIAKEYFMGIGGNKNGVIEYSDEYKFIEDMRYFKIKQYGAGRAFDNTSALYLDISGLEEAYITVKETTVTA